VKYIPPFHNNAQQEIEPIGVWVGVASKPVYQEHGNGATEPIPDVGIKKRKPPNDVRIHAPPQDKGGYSQTYEADTPT
jgi:hypothetical protein